MTSAKSRGVVKKLITVLSRISSVLVMVFALVLATVSMSALSSQAQSDDVRRLEDNIATLKSKIRTSNAKDPKDIQRLYKLENELEKKQYLQKNNKGR